MDQQQFEQAVLALIHREGQTRLRAPDVAARLRMQERDAESALDRLVTEGKLELDSDDDGNLFYFVPGMGIAGVFNPGAALGPSAGVTPSSSSPAPGSGWSGAPTGGPPWQSSAPRGAWQGPPGTPQGPAAGPQTGGWGGSPAASAPWQAANGPQHPAQQGPPPGWNPQARNAGPAYGPSGPWNGPGGPHAPSQQGWNGGPNPGAPQGPWQGQPPSPAAWGPAPGQHPGGWQPQQQPQGPYGPQQHPPTWQQAQQAAPQAPWAGQQHPMVPYQGNHYPQAPHAGQVREPKSPVTSALLSLFFPGAGQLYNGQVGKGLTFFFLTMLLLAAFPFALIPWVWSMIDAHETSRRLNASYGLLPP